MCRSEYGGGYDQVEQFQVGVGHSVEYFELGMPGMWWKNGWAGKRVQVPRPLPDRLASILAKSFSTSDHPPPVRRSLIGAVMLSEEKAAVL